MCEDALGIVRRTARVRESAREIARLCEMMSEVLHVIVQLCRRRGGGLGRRTVEPLQRFADSLVQAALADRVQLFVEDLTDLVVREREVIVLSGRDWPVVAICAHELRGAGLIECVEQRLDVSRSHGGQLIERKDLAQRRGRPQRVYCGIGQPREAPADRLLHALRIRKLVHLLAFPATVLAIDLSLLDQRLDDLL